MQINVSYDRPEDEPGSGPVNVGWLLTTDKTGIIFHPPERVRSVEVNRQHAKSASRCPAIINLESRYFVIRSPYDLNLQFVRHEKNNQPGIRNVAGTKSTIRSNKLNELISVTNEAEWRYPDRPTLQLQLPFVFIADEPVYLSQVPPFLHYLRDPWPGTLFGGRFPINIWPRPLMFAFEWHDIKKNLVIRRGDPMFYCQFETMPQDRGVQVVEAEKTPQLQEYMDQISGAVNFVNQTFSLFKAAEKIRPEKLVTPKRDV